MAEGMQRPFGQADIAVSDGKDDPDVPSDTKPAPGPVAPTPMADAALSPPPPAIGILEPSSPQALAIAGLRCAETSEPSTRLGIAARESPVAASRTSSQRRLATSSQDVPEASDMSDTASPERRRRT